MQSCRLFFPGFVLCAMLLFALSSSATATSNGEITFTSEQFLLRLYYTYGHDMLDRGQYIDDTHLAFKYATFLYEKELFNESFKRDYQEDPLTIWVDVRVWRKIYHFREPSDYEVNPFLLKNTGEVRALAIPDVFTLQLVIYPSERWLDRFKTEFKQQLQTFHSLQPDNNLHQYVFIDGTFNKEIPIYVIAVRDDEGKLVYYVRYGIFISFDDAQDAAEWLSHQLGFPVQVLKRPLTRRLIWKTLFDASFRM